MTARAIAYCRVSTAEQATSGLGLAAQEAAIRAHCEAQGWALVDVLRDEGQSAKDLVRPGISQALDRLVAGEASTLVVAKLDRLTRSTLDLATLLEWAERANIGLVALDLGLDTSTPTGRLVASVMGSVASWEREVIAQRTRDAMAIRRAEGGRTGRPAVRDSMPEVAARICAERAAGMTLQAIADGLNRDKIPTVRGGAEWRPSSVRSAGGWKRRPAPRKAPGLPEVRRRRSATA